MKRSSVCHWDGNVAGHSAVDIFPGSVLCSTCIKNQYQRCGRCYGCRDRKIGAQRKGRHPGHGENIVLTENGCVKY